MKCPHCQTEYFANWIETQVNVHSAAIMDFDGELYGIDPRVLCATCASCLKPTFQFKVEHKNTTDIAYKSQIYPRGGILPPPPSEVPSAVAADYIEANEVLTISPKASAALARRCLQAMLSSHGYSGRDLMRQVEAVLNETDASKALPSSIRESIDAVRNFGNFSAHPITDQTTLQLVEVEEGEAEWCLQILLDLFDHFYVAPARSAARRAALANKLSLAGKPPMKT